MLFARAILAGEPIRLFNDGRMQRDLTYIDDIVQGLISCIDKPSTAAVPHRLCNIDNDQLASPFVQLHRHGEYWSVHALCRTGGHGSLRQNVNCSSC